MRLLVDLKKDDEIRVFEDLDDVDFPRQEFVDVVPRRASLGDDLDGDVRLVSFGVGQLHGGVRALPEAPLKSVAVRLEHRLSSLVVDVLVVRFLFLPSVLRRHRRLHRRSAVGLFNIIVTYYTYRVSQKNNE